MAGKKGLAGRKKITCCKKMKQTYIMVEGCDINTLGGETHTKMAMTLGINISKRIKADSEFEKKLNELLK